jgi:hypothetical protein
MIGHAQVHRGRDPQGFMGVATIVMSHIGRDGCGLILQPLWEPIREAAKQIAKALVTLAERIGKRSSPMVPSRSSAKSLLPIWQTDVCIVPCICHAMDGPHFRKGD